MMASNLPTRILIVEDDQDDFRVKFIYKFVEGACPNSFGLNVAKMAGLPLSVLNRAKHKSLGFTESMNTRMAVGRARMIDGQNIDNSESS